MILFLFLPWELILGPDHNLKTCSEILLFKTSKFHNFQLSEIHTIPFFLKRVRPDSIDRAVGLGHIEFKQEPSPTEELQKKCFFFFIVANSTHARKQGAFRGPPRPSLHHCYALIINSGKWPTRTPKCNLRRSWHCGSSAPALAMSQKRAQSGCPLWPHQLLNGS